MRPIRLDRDTLRTDEAEQEIRRRLDIGSPTVTLHAFERLEEREEQDQLNSADMMRILEKGFIQEEPEKTDEGWIVTVTMRMAGCRDAGVVTAILVPGDDLIVITVEWMDWL